MSLKDRVTGASGEVTTEAVATRALFTLGGMGLVNFLAVRFDLLTDAEIITLDPFIGAVCFGLAGAYDRFIR